MPCRSDYLDPNETEIELSRVLCLLDELNGKKWTKNDWEGYKAYMCADQERLNAKTAELCSRLQKTDVTKYSLELQVWWRDHQAADRERIKKELAGKKTAAAKDAALSKLTPYERKLLGL